jgi:hypothetical protein
LTILRVMLFLLALVAQQAPDIAEFWLPPFERTVGVVSLGFLVWGFTPFMREQGFNGTILLAVNTAFAFIFFGLAVLFGSGGVLIRATGNLLISAFWLCLGPSTAPQMDDERTFALFGLARWAWAIAPLSSPVAGERYPPQPDCWVRLGEMIAYPVYRSGLSRGHSMLSARPAVPEPE